MDAQNLIDQIISFRFDEGDVQLKARDAFIQKFPESRIAELSAEEYNGGKSNDSFCYNLEFKPDLPFGIGGRSNKKFGRTNNVSTLTRGIASMIEDARKGRVKELRKKHELESISQDVLIKILSIYLPDKFISIGQEYPLLLLSKVIEIDQEGVDLIELNYLCMEKLIEIEPAIAGFRYNQLGSAIWAVLSPEVKKGYSAWLDDHYAENSGAKNAYLNCIERLSYFYRENYFSKHIQSQVLSDLYETTKRYQKENDGKYYYPSPSYGLSMYYSAAVKALLDYTNSTEINQVSSPAHETKPSAPNPSLSSEESSNSADPHNIILYGPPGTGKTYNSIRYAVSIIEGIDVSSILGEDSYIDSMGTTKEVKEAFDSFVKDKRISFITFHQSFSYEDFIEGLKPEPDESKMNVLYNPVSGVFKKICKEAKDKEGNYVLIIDEINRGNVSQIFGELITLIEEDKREGTKGVVKCTLPYSHESFSVPKNLYIIGTMNTADRSVEALDTALRRRFDFIEMLPNSKLVTYRNDIFNLINKRIEVLKDAEHQIGHSYFMRVKDDADLRKVFQKKLIPLLQEYFYGDTERIRLVVGEGFFHEEKVEQKKLFPGYSGDIDIPRSVWRIWGKDDWEKCEADPSLFTNALEVLTNGDSKAEAEEKEEQS